MNYFKMLRIDFRDNHRYIRCPAMCTVIGNNRCFCLCVCIFNRTDFFFGHIYCAEYKIHAGSDLFHFIYIHYYKRFYCLRHWSFHFPSSAYGLFICFSGRTRACSNGCHFKPRVIFQERNKSLSYHTCCAKNTNF